MVFFCRLTQTETTFIEQAGIAAEPVTSVRFHQARAGAGGSTTFTLPTPTQAQGLEKWCGCLRRKSNASDGPIIEINWRKKEYGPRVVRTLERLMHCVGMQGERYRSSYF